MDDTCLDGIVSFSIVDIRKKIENELNVAYYFHVFHGKKEPLEARSFPRGCKSKFVSTFLKLNLSPAYHLLFYWPRLYEEGSFVREYCFITGKL